MAAFFKIFFALLLVLSGVRAYAVNYFTACIEGSPTGYLTCRLKPDGFTNWVYDSGYGVAPRDAGGSYSSEEKAAYETVNYLVYSNPNVANFCNITYSLEGAVEVMGRDDFSQSKESVWQKRKLKISHGMLGEKGCQNIGVGYVDIFAKREVLCNPEQEGYAEWASDLPSTMCTNRLSRIPPPCNTCPEIALKGNPILVPTREKVERALDLASSGPMPLEFLRIYRSHRARDKKFWFNDYFKGPAQGFMGSGWFHNHNIYLAVAGAGNEGLASARSGTQSGVDAGTGPLLVRIHMGDGTFNYFYRPNSDSSFVGRNKLQTLTKSDTQWVFTDGEAEIRYTFDPKGLLLEQTYRNGWRLLYGYNAQDLLAVVQNDFGQSLHFSYLSGRLATVTSNDQRSVALGYSDTTLTSVQQADGSIVQYVYAPATAKIPPLLAGHIDEQGVRYATFSYDVDGWALSTEKAGGVDKYTVPAPGQLVDPLGTLRNHTFRVYGNELVFEGSSPAPASPTESPVKGRAIRSDALIEYEYDQRLTYSSFQWNEARRLPISAIEASGTRESRTTQIEWHPQWRLPTTITEPGRVTTYTYDSRGNPLSQTMVDTGASPGGSGGPRTTSWTYHPSGLVATETAPNGATTSYQYDSAGNLTRATNALGYTDTYTHDAAGRVLTHTSPTGLVTAYTYDARDRVLTVNQGGLLTTLTYRPSGQVATVRLPQGLVVTYTYDAAQRLTGWSDNRGNSGAYTLDGMGNRTLEDIRNAQGQTVWRLARTINSINRVEAFTVGSHAFTQGYDNNGDQTSVTNALYQGAAYGRDPLRRINAIYNSEYGAASLTYNAQDAITQAKDFKGVATTYTRDALGNATSETSPDSGATTAQYDALGLPKTVTDALGQATTIERDLLGRPTLITYADGRTTTLRYDLTATSKGYLGEIVDASGTTTYERDAHGRVTKKTQRLINGDTRSVSYSYNAQGLLASTTYPGGQALQYVYDTTGQLTGLTWAGQPGQPLVISGITWNPLGQPTGWSWNLPGSSTPIPATRSYNTAGQLTATEFSSYQYDAAGRINGITQNLWQPASTNPQDSTLTQEASAWTVQYSPTGRITSFTRTTAANTPADTATFQYDPNGNRKSSTRNVAGTSTSRTYSGEASHNRLLGFNQTTSAGGNTASTSVTYQYNSAGDLLSDGLTSYHYDSEGRLDSATTGQGPDAPTTKYAHNALGQRVFKTEPLFSSAATPGTGKNLNNLLADDDEKEEGEQEPPGLIQQFLNFWSKLWSPSTSDAEKLGWSYVYAEDGSLLGEYGSGGSASSGTSQYIYLPTASGPMPIAAIIKGQTYAVHSDHLNTPRRLTQADGQAAWQWAYSAFGEEQPTTGAKRFTSETTTPSTGSTSIPEVTFNLRYPGQYFDSETKLHYNWNRTYDSRTGRYTQEDPIGLDGGWNRFGYVSGNPLNATDPSGLVDTLNARILALAARGDIEGAIFLAQTAGGGAGATLLASRLQQLQTSIQTLTTRYPLASNKCVEVADGIAKTAKAIDLTPQFIRVAPTQTPFVYIGDKYTAVQHFAVRFGDRVYDAYTGTQGMLYGQYVNMLNNSNLGPNSYILQTVKSLDAYK